jgi:hypothetical protein
VLHPRQNVRYIYTSTTCGGGKGVEEGLDTWGGAGERVVQSPKERNSDRERACERQARGNITSFHPSSVRAHVPGSFLVYVYMH